MSRFYYVLSPTIYISILLGTGILIIHRSKNKIELTIAPRAIYLTYIRIAFYGVLILHAFALTNYDEIFTKYDDTLVYLGFFIPPIVGIIFMALMYFSGLINVKEVTKTIKNISDIDNMLVDNLGATYSDLKYRKTYRYQIFYYGIGTFVFLLIMTSHLLIIRDFRFFDGFSSMKTITYFPMLADYINGGQYIAIVKILFYRIQYINKEIGNLNKRNNLFFIDDDSEVRIRKNDICVINKLEELMNIYDLLCDVGSELNRLKGLQILFSIGFKFTLLIFSIYYSYWCNFVKNQLNISVYWFMWAIFHSMTLLHLTICCQTATSEAQRTSIQIHKLLLIVRNAIIKEKLLIFSLHRLHRPIKFNALEIFNIDATLFLTIIGTVSTYLVIMLQFQNHPDSFK